MKLFNTLLISVLSFTASVQAQLSTFNLQVSKTDETCLGNGSLTFNATNLTPGASVLYKVYLLPDTSSVLTVTTGNYLGSLSAGTYKIVAVQSLGNQSNTQEKTATINEAIVPFNFEVASSNQNCATGGNIVVNTTSGIAANFEIISGPVTRPLQTSNVFPDLPEGTYNIRAYNNCGAAKVKTFTLVIVANGLAISAPIFPQSVPECDEITVINNITPTSGTIAYPVTVTHTLEPLDIGGEAIVINQTFATGSPTLLAVSATVPRYMTEPYMYSLSVTDNCAVVYQKNDNVVDPNISLALSDAKAPCADKYLKLNASKYTGSYTVNFIKTPDEFVPANFHATPFGPFGTANVDYGSEENPVPFGEYIVEITDVCGRTATDTLEVKFEKPKPSAVAGNNGCFSEYGWIRIQVPDQKLVSAIITAAPARYLLEYNVTLSEDVSNHINVEGKLILQNMPLDRYTLTVTDDCGFEYVIEVKVPEYLERPFFIETLPSCEPGFGTVRAGSGNGELTAIRIVSTDTNYSIGDVSANITTNGAMYINNLPEGNYVFEATDICGVVKELPVAVLGYNNMNDMVVFTPNCGSFSVLINDTSNGMEKAGYWLQQYDESLNAWIHPYYGEAYVEGTVPGTTTGIKLTNELERNNLTYTGKFRVIKKFETFSNASPVNTVCLSVLDEFTYTEDLSISAAYSLACLGQPNNVLIEVSGFPTSYKIKEKNGASFVVDNGVNNIFENLEPAEYLFQIEDACGNIDVQGINVQSLPSLATPQQPQDMIECTEPGTANNFEFRLTAQNPTILGSLHSAVYTITYHLTQEDADNATNPLPEFYRNTANGQEIYARLVHNEIAICHGTTSFRLFVGEYQEPVITTVGTICNEGRITLTANAGYDNYEWSTGETTRTIYVTEPGNYTVVVEKIYGNRFCDGYAEVTIEASVTPSIVKIDTSDWTRDQNTITVHAKGSGNYEYSLDDITYQKENVFTGLETGVYQVFVRDGNGCGKDAREVVLMNYPNFFTPNGDGVHDTWRIPYSVKEPHLEVAIFDRYGKHITSFGPNHEGWDGTLNGIQLPSTDYWFVVTREDGRELKGHFSMLR